MKALLLACALATLPALRTVVIDAAIAAVGFLISTTQPAAAQMPEGAIPVELIWKQALKDRQEAIKPNIPLYPPARYDHPYNGLLTTIIADDAIDMKHRCWPATGIHLEGCAWPFGPPHSDMPFDQRRRCRIIIAPDFVLAEHNLIWHRKVTREDVIRHEIAHCNGWPGDHPP